MELSEEQSAQIAFLWMDVSKEGIARQENAPAPARVLTLDDWLNVIDEAAGYGVNWLILTLRTSPSRHPDIWKIAQWAQEAHGMRLGIHIAVDNLTDDEVDSFSRLDGTKITLYVKQDLHERLAPLESMGIKIGLADPQTYGERPNCNGPARMIFTDPEGVLYTCGLVQGNQTFRLGTIFEKTFKEILQDPNLPHAVPKTMHHVSEGCDGCPSLIVNFTES
ncbi:MAG TPA: hypothetical protein PLI09_15275 [Candidatus Hydrogenedentes bacterium]|nr:hypothetical protein [Candidatus Hydrogenedentota bacterium]